MQQEKREITKPSCLYAHQKSLSRRSACNILIRRIMVNRRSVWITSAVIVLAVGIGAFIVNGKRQAPVKASVTTQTTTTPTLEFLASDMTQVAPHDLKQILSATGSLRAVNQAAVKAKIAGDVRKVLVREGEAVKAGQVVIEMDPAEYQARLEQAKGVLKAARGQLDIAMKTRNNNKALLEQGFISQNAFDNAESQYQIALANLESAKGAFDVAQKILGDTTIRAPISGLVSSRTIQPGEKVSADNRLLDVVDLSQMELESSVATTDIMRIALGQEVQVKVEGLSTALAGKVVRMNPSTQSGSRSILVYIQVNNPQGVLRVGMFGEAQLTLAKKTNVLTIPQSAVFMDAGNASVYAVENGKLIKKPVALGIKGSDGDIAAVEVMSGLRNGDQIVKNNLGNLREGTLVQFSKPAGNNAKKQ